MNIKDHVVHIKERDVFLIWKVTRRIYLVINLLLISLLESSVGLNSKKKKAVSDKKDDAGTVYPQMDSVRLKTNSQCHKKTSMHIDRMKGNRVTKKRLKYREKNNGREQNQ
jgi:hypothetical protein